jgi:hypothetical protein
LRRRVARFARRPASTPATRRSFLSAK